MKRSLFSLSMTVLLAVVLTACQEVDQTPPRATGQNPCNPAPVKTPGQLTVGAELLNYPPFLIGKGTDPPPTGFEADLVNEIARRLRLQVVWQNTSFDSLFAPGAKEWDFGVSQMTITPEREQAVDFSVPYLKADQSLVVQTGTPIENVTTIADLKQYKLGGESGTTGTEFAKKTIDPDEPVSEFDTTADAAQALKSGTIDGQIIDFPIASGIVSESKTVPLKIVGFFKTNENYGLAFEKGSQLKQCVDQAINAMRADGFLPEAEKKWIPPGTQGLPEIT
ncbi:MAG TPA: ABC transporter substrate-binding protein [Actinomycetota bacterium]|nr:ABC transporter substrate-binding protein [Actinomycetota bacterium]